MDDSNLTSVLGNELSKSLKPLNRRSSILKSRQALVDVDSNLPGSTTVVEPQPIVDKKTRRVSFADTNQIREISKWIMEPIESSLECGEKLDLAHDQDIVASFSLVDDCKLESSKSALSLLIPQRVFSHATNSDHAGINSLNPTSHHYSQFRDINEPVISNNDDMSMDITRCFEERSLLDGAEMRPSRKTGADRLSVSHHLDRTRFDHSAMEFTACHTAEMDMLDMRAYDGEELSHLDRTVHFPEQLELSSSREDKDDEVFLDLEPDLPPSSNDTFKMSLKACDRTRIFTSEGADMEETGIFNGTLSDMSAYFQEKMCENDLRDRNNGPYDPTTFKSTRTSNFEKTPNDVSEKSSKDFDQTKIFTSEGAEMEETRVFSGTLTELTTDSREMIGQKKLEVENRAQNKDMIPRTYGMNNLEKTTIFSPTGGAMEEIGLFDKSDLFTSKRLMDKLSRENVDWENMSTRVYTDSYVMSILEKSDFQSIGEEQRKNPGSNYEDCTKEFDTHSFLAHLGGNKQKDVSLSTESRPNLGFNYVDRMQEVDTNSFLSHLGGLKQKDALLSTEYRLPQSEDDSSGVFRSSSVSAAVPETFDTLMFLNDLDKKTSFSTEPRAKSLSRAAANSTTLDEENGQQAKTLDQDKVRMQEESIPVQLHEEKFTVDRIFEGKKVVAPKRGIYIKVGGSKSTSESKGTSEDKNDNGGPTKKSRIGSWSETQIKTGPVSVSNETINTQTNVSVDQPLRQFKDTTGPTMNELNSQATDEICAEMSMKCPEFDSPEKPTKSLMRSRLEDRTVDLLNKDFSAIEMRVHDNSFEDFELENISKLIPFGFNDMSRLKNSTAMLDLTQPDRGCRIGEVSRGIMSITQMNFTSILGDDLVNSSAMIAQMPLLKGSDSLFADESVMNSICIEQEELEDVDVSRSSGKPDKVSDSADDERRSEIWNNMTTCVYSKSFLESLDQKVEAGDPRAELVQVLRNDDSVIEKSSSENQIETVTTNSEAESAPVETETVGMVTAEVENEIKIVETETQKDETAETRRIEPETPRVECGTTTIAEQNFELESMAIETTQFVEMEIDSERFLPEPSVVGEKLVETECNSSAGDIENIPDNRVSSPHHDETVSTKRFLNVSNNEILKSSEANLNSSIEPELKRLKLQNVENDILPKVQSSNDNDSTMASTSFSSKFADCSNSFKPSLFASSQSSDGKSLTEPTSSSSQSVDGRSLMEPISSSSQSVDGRSLMEPISSSSHSVDGRSLMEPISSSSHSVDGRSLTESSRSLSRPAKNTCLTSTSSYLKSSMLSAEELIQDSFDWAEFVPEFDQLQQFVISLERLVCQELKNKKEESKSEREKEKLAKHVAEIESNRQRLSESYAYFEHALKERSRSESGLRPKSKVNELLRLKVNAVESCSDLMNQRLLSFVPWDLEVWDASGATFSYLDETLFLKVKFGSFVDNNHLALHKKPVKEIVDFDITSHFKGDSSPECHLAHRLVWDAIDVSSLQRQTPDSSHLALTLQNIGKIVLHADAYREAIYQLDRSHILQRVRIDNKSLSVNFVSVPRSSKICIKCTDLNLSCIPKWSCECVFGRIDLNEISTLINNVRSAGIDYLKNVFSTIKSWSTEPIRGSDINDRN